MNNLRKTGSVRFSHLEGLNMYVYRAAGAVSMRDHKPLFQVHREMGLETERTDFTGWAAKRPEFAGRNHAALGEQWFRDGIAIIAHNPGWYALIYLRSIAALLFDPGTFCLATMVGLETDQRGQELLARIQTAPASVTAAVVVAVLAYFVIISAGPEAASRFRVPLAPLLALLSAAGWQRLRESRGR